MMLQEGVEEELDNNNEDIPDDIVGEGEEKVQETSERPRKTSKYITRYEHARILGTRALQIRYIVSAFFFVLNSPIFSLSQCLTWVVQYECSSDG